jgi:opacity protein-like surface antigen
MKKLFAISTLAATAALGFAGSATAADMPVKAAPPPVPVVYDWSGLYVGVHSGYEWSTVGDTITGVFTQTDSTVENGIIGFHAGLQKQFGGFGFGNIVLGVEGGLNEPMNRNSLSNFTACGNPAFACGITNFKDNWYAGGRLGLAFSLPQMPLWLGGEYLLTVSGGWTTAIFQRADFCVRGAPFCPAGAINAGGGNSLAWHDGAYVGAGLEHVLAKGNLVDWVSGIDWQHQFYDGQGDRDANGVIHVLSADRDIIRFRTTLKFK